MKAFVESCAKGDEAAELLSNYYYNVACEGCNSSAFIKRRTVKGWKGIRSSSIVFAEPTKQEEARAAARHRLVDVVSFNARTLRYLDESEALLVLQGGKAVEINVTSVLTRYKALHDLDKSVELLLNKWVPTLFTCCPSTPFEICHPSQIVSLVETLGYSEGDVEALWSLGSNWIISRYEAKSGMKRVLRSD